jgi:LysM repeat protein
MAEISTPGVKKQAQVTRPFGLVGLDGKTAAPAQKPAAAPTAPLDSSAVAPSEYTVVKNDTLCDIARRFKVPYKTLVELNPHLTQGGRRTPAGDLIYPGDKVILRKAPQTEADKLRDQVKAAQAELAKLKERATADKAAAEAANAKAVPASI